MTDFVPCTVLFNPFQLDTMRVIFSFTDTDPEGIIGLDYHGTNRGSKSVVLINYKDGEQQLPDDSFPMDILITEVVGNHF